MEVLRRIRPLLTSSAGVIFFATAAAAGPPTAGNCVELPGGGTATGEYGTSCAANCASRHGLACSCGRSHGSAGHWWQFGSGDDNGLIGAEQKYHKGKLWPPYPRPQENGSFCTQYHAAHYWPHPYNCWDRAWTQQILAQQTANGWEQATTLCDYHFDPETNALNEAGLIHLRWILSHVPGQYRTVYVQACNQNVASATRQASVESESMAMMGSHTAPVIVRAVQLAGRPANEVDSIRRSEIRTIPAPRVTLDSVGTGAGDGGT